MVLKDTGKLKLKPGIIDRFVEEAKKDNKWGQFNTNMKLFIMAHYYLDSKIFSLPYRSKYLQKRNLIVGNFLLSTDFFQKKMDVTREIEYIALNHPYKNPCSNPFSSIFYPA